MRQASLPPRSAASPAAQACTYGHRRRDFVAWHRGRPVYLLWALDVDQPQVRRQVSIVQNQLAPLLLPSYRRQPHVTLSVCGFPQPHPTEADEFGPALLAAQLQALQQASLAPFELAIGALATFLAAPYLQVSTAGSQLSQLNRLLSIAPPAGAAPAYEAHLTLGLYRQRQRLHRVASVLASISEPAPLRLAIEHLSLYAYASREIDGPLQTLGRYVLHSQHFIPSTELHQQLPFLLPPQA